MLADTPMTICKRLAENEADIAIIGRDQVTSDVPPHNHLRDQECATGNRTFDNGTRGVGGNMSCPTCSVGQPLSIVMGFAYTCAACCMHIAIASDRNLSLLNCFLLHEDACACLQHLFDCNFVL